MHQRKSGLLIVSEGLTNHDTGIAFALTRTHIDQNPKAFGHLHCIESAIHGKEIDALAHAMIPLANRYPKQRIGAPDELLIRIASYLETCREHEIPELLKQGKSVFIHLPLMMIAPHGGEEGVDRMNKLRSAIKRALAEFCQNENLFHVDHYIYLKLAPHLMVERLMKGNVAESSLDFFKEAERISQQMESRIRKAPGMYSVIDGSLGYAKLKDQIVSVLERIMEDHYGLRMQVA